jgi:hypothetical protein
VSELFHNQVSFGEVELGEQFKDELNYLNVKLREPVRATVRGKRVTVNAVNCDLGEARSFRPEAFAFIKFS